MEDTRIDIKSIVLQHNREVTRVFTMSFDVSLEELRFSHKPENGSDITFGLFNESKTAGLQYQLERTGSFRITKP